MFTDTISKIGNPNFVSVYHLLQGISVQLNFGVFNTTSFVMENYVANGFNETSNMHGRKYQSSLTKFKD